MNYNRHELLLLFASLAIIGISLVSIIFFWSFSACDGRYVSLTFDDGHLDTHTQAFPITETYNIPATTYVMPGLVNETFEGKELMDWRQLHDLQQNGWEIGSQTNSHANLTSLNIQRAKKELLMSKKRLKERGFNASTLAVPFGAYNQTIARLAEDHYKAVRPSIWGTNDINNLNVSHIRSLWVTNTTDWRTIRNGIKSLDNGEWAVIGLHQVEETVNNARYAVKPSFLRNISDYIDSRDIKVKTVGNMIDIPCRR